MSILSAPRRRRPSRGNFTSLFLAGAVLVLALSLTGCHCTDPEPQIDWQPDTGEFNRLAGRVSESGLWQGTRFQWDPPGYIKQIKAVCTSDDCDHWKYHEGNCHEKTFGKCSCKEMSENGKFCTRWFCSDLEADQYVCHYVQECHHHHHYQQGGPDSLSLRNHHHHHHHDDDDTTDDDTNNDDDTTDDDECEWKKECFESELEMDEYKYDIYKSQQVKFEQMQRSSGERLFAFIVHDASTWGWQNQAVCIVPGDFEGTIEEQVMSQRHYCLGQAFFREIEEEMQHCSCNLEGSNQTHCSSWSCVQHKSGLFGVLFEKPPPNFKDLVDGLLKKEFRCDIDGDGVGGCQRWSGKHRSWKEADMSKCVCKDRNCTAWVCDEYKVMVPQPWIWYVGTWLPALITLPVLCLAGTSAIIKKDSKGGTCLMTATVFVAGLVFWSLGVWGFFFIVLLPAICCCGYVGAMLGHDVSKEKDHSNELEESSVLNSSAVLGEGL